jgi:hypothetical protein
MYLQRRGKSLEVIYPVRIFLINNGCFNVRKKKEEKNRMITTLNASPV